MPLSRTRYEMPAFIEEAISARGLVDAYRSRPDYQQNDYIGWITRAKREETRQKRLNQMLDELAKGGVYMKMIWHEKD
jgi:uncharacterized protein YdeI (YjbR/CyaY-like superfamily)